MAIDFPASPSSGAVHSSGGRSWKWNGTSWDSSSPFSYALTLSDSAPAGAVAGSMWWNSTTGTLQVYYVDADSAQWVDASPSSTLTSAQVDALVTLTGGQTLTNKILTTPVLNSPTISGTVALSNPGLTGTPTTPTASAGTNTTQIASTAFVTDAITTGLAGVSGYYNVVVTVVNSGGNKYALDGTVQQIAGLVQSGTYRFDQSDSSNSSHPLRFSTTSNGTHASGSAYTTGVTEVGTPGSSGAYTQIIVQQDTPQLFYYCGNHSGMGARAKVGNKTYSTTTVTSSSATLAINSANLVTAAGQTVTLPLEPVAGDRVTVCVGNFVNTIVARNGSNIVGLAQDFTIDTANMGLEFVYFDASNGWRVV